MGTMLQGYDLTLDDFDQLEGCNEILNVTRPDIVRAIHDAYFEVGVDAVETNTFGTNLVGAGRVRHLRPDLRAGRGRGPDRPGVGRRVQHRPTGRRWVLGSVGPGHQAAHPGPRRRTRSCGTRTSSQVEGMLAGGIDAVLIETSQDLLQTKAATLGAKRALAARRPATCRSSCTSPWRPPAPCCSAPRSGPR